MTALKSYFCEGGDVPLLKETIWEHFSRVAGRFPENDAVVSIPQGRRLNYLEFAEAASELARGLLGSGFNKGNRIGIWATNNIEWLLLQMATARIGAILVNINPAYRPKELEYALARSEIEGLFVMPSFRQSNYVEMLLLLLPELSEPVCAGGGFKGFPSLRRVVIYDPSSPLETKRPAPGFTLWQEIIEAASRVTFERLDEVGQSLDINEPINIQYTSGTTGFPKAVVLTHYNILNNAYFSALAMRFTESDRLCVPVPFYHCFGMVVSNLLCFSVGAALVIPCEHFDPLAVLKAVETERCTALHGVPTMFIAELECEEFKEIDTSTLRTGIMAGAPCPPALMKRVIEEMHCAGILIGYGQTEASPITHLTHMEDSLKRRTETVGKNLPHQEVKVVDHSTGETVELGKVGEVCFRGYHIMKGYYADQEATSGAIDNDGWLHSGDLGKMDADGYLEITGRLKEMIIRGGENIYPREIEDLIFTHPKVAEVAVFGIPDEYFGEEIMAWIELHSGETLSEEEIREFLRERIAHFKVPKYIRFVDEFPMTVTGKLQKFRMREIAVERMRN